jgi:hypothetical protein
MNSGIWQDYIASSVRYSIMELQSIIDALEQNDPMPDNQLESQLKQAESKLAFMRKRIKNFPYCS